MNELYLVFEVALLKGVSRIDDLPIGSVKMITLFLFIIKLERSMRFIDEQTQQNYYRYLCERQQMLD